MMYDWDGNGWGVGTWLAMAVFMLISWGGLVSVALDDAVTRGTADDVLVGFSSAGRQFSVPHDLNITIDRTTCS